MTIDPSELRAAGDVMVVDDSHDNLRLLCDVLAGAGLGVRPASDGELALRSARAKPPALILLDIRMPGLDGFEVCRQLKADAATRDIPVIFASGLTDTAERIRGFELGAVDYVTKPLNAQEVLMRVTTHLRLFLALRDLAARNRSLADTEAALRLAMQRAEAATVAKDAFLANMSHEMRTPLNHIDGMAHLIAREGVSGQQAERLAKLHSAVRHLTGIVDAILELTRIDVGGTELERVPVHVAAVLDGVATSLRDKAEARGLLLVTSADKVPNDLSGDARRIRSALFNYVDNAIKFTETGTIVIRAEAVESDGRSALLRFEVEDTGCGIQAEVLPRLFRAFERADNSPTRSHHGTGVGLAITRKLARMMGGDAGCTSTPGVGSTFWFTVRLERQ